MRCRAVDDAAAADKQADDGGRTVLDPVLGRVASQRDHAFVAEATLWAADGGLTCSVLALPADHRLAAMRSVAEL